MKIGIMSMQRIINYGSYLQAYGLKTTLENMGHDVNYIDYHVRMPLLSENNIIEETNYFKRLLKKKNKILLIKYKLFQRKFKTFFPIIGIDNSKYVYDASECDVLVIGSDEVFNCCQNNRLVGYTTDLFGKNCMAKKIISYAASFGNTTIEQLYKFKKNEEIGRLLSKFDSISVRDKNSFHIIEKLLSTKANINIDPVLLYDFKDDKKFLNITNVKKRYIILYAYSFRMTKDECDIIKNFARNNNLKIITIGGVQTIGKFVSCSPFEVLSYFENAEYIITDTFHGTIFSIITHSNFTTLIRPSENNSYGNEEKLSYLLTSLSLISRAQYTITDLEKEYSSIVDYNNCDKILKTERKNAWNYLKKNINL